MAQIPNVKLKHFATEAMSLDAARMKELEPQKRYTLAAALIATQSARTLDDLASMFIRRMQKIHVKAKEALDKYREEYQARTDRLITTLRDVVVAYSTEGEVTQRFTEIEKALGENPDQLLTECEAHLAYVGNNYYPFLWRFYRSHRAILFQILKQVQLRSTTQDKSIEASIQFLIDHQGSRKDWLDVVKTEETQRVQLLDLDWIPNKWWQLITNQKTRKSYPDSINRRYFEMCVFSQVMWELKSGDLYVENSDAFADYRTQQISWTEYQANIDDFMEYLGSQELRQTIQSALNKTEAFNGFTKWVGFGSAGMIQNNNREEQRKIIKYNHLVSNCLIFYNVFEISRILQEYIQAGHTIEPEIISVLSPYLTKHINRFGSYSLDLNRNPPALNFGFSLIPS